MRKAISAALAVLSAVIALRLLQGCGGGAPVHPTGAVQGTISGRVVKGPVANALVSVYRLDARLVRGAVAGSATTDEAGVYKVALKAEAGRLEVVASTGTYLEEAIGSAVKLDGHELSYVLPDYRPGTTVEHVTLTPVSTWAAAFARSHVMKKGEEPGAALRDAWAHLGSHLGGLDWSSTEPANLTVPGVSSLTGEATAGLVLAALSEEARGVSVDSGLSPGLVVNAATLSEALALDASDGTFDGASPGGALAQGSYRLGAGTLRDRLARSMLAFVRSGRNASSLSAADVTKLATAVAGGSDPYLFCAGQDAASGCPGSVLDADPPTVTFAKPVDGAGVHGSVDIAATATDAGGVASFSFTAPAALLKAAATTDPDGLTAHLTATLDVSALPDGPLAVTVEAHDQSGNVTTRTLTLTVANHGPRISIQSPAPGSTVKGTISVLASATAEQGTLASLTIPGADAPAGMGPDGTPAADAFAATWDTTKALEGPTKVHFHAEDSLGGVSDELVDVVVDNVPFGTVDAFVSAGAPVAGATVRVVAIDDTTGRPAKSVGTGGELGRGGPTDASGHVLVTLSVENYEGPIQIVADGTSLTFVDPSDGKTQIAIPGSFAFTSYVGHCRTGTAISAPLSLWTTLADVEALAYVEGRHRTDPTHHALSAALVFGDPLFTGHVIAAPPWDLRTASPASLTSGGSQTLRDVVYAALPDVAMSSLARDLSVRANLSPGSVITAASLAALFEDDIAADGQLDGQGTGGVLLKTPGSSAQSLDANTLRFALATALDEFVQGPTNASGLARIDIQNAGIYDRIADDVSALFGSQAPVPFDNEAPVVRAAATFYGSDNLNHAAVGSSMLVSGTVGLTVDATDPSGVASLAVTVNGQPLPAGQGSSQTHFSGNLDTRQLQDGPLVFSITAADLHGNSATSPFTVTVDNTKPAIAVLSPTPGYYSGAVNVEATASDANGIGAAGVGGLANFADQDPTPERIYGTWNTAGPPAVPEGPVSLTFAACDQVTNCVIVPVALHVDHTAPTVAFSAAPARYTSLSTTSFSVTASDGTGAGVATVYAQPVAPQTGTPVAGTLAGSTWYFSGLPLTAGYNRIAVWADDLATPANSGMSNPLYANITLDRTPPSATIYPFPSYQDERGMTLVEASPGIPAMPAAYQFPAGSTKVALGPQTTMTVYKAATRLGWGPAPAPGSTDIEGPNPGNVPFLQVSIPFDAVNDAPIRFATYSIATSCSGCPALPTATGSLWPSPQSTPSVLYFDLPLTSDTVPALGSVHGAAALALSMTFIDSAANSATLTASVTFHVLGAPISWREDTSYAASSSSSQDRKSVHAYKVADGSYADAFKNGVGSADGVLRVKRYEVRNPSPQPVAISLPVNQVIDPSSQPMEVSWNTVEEWDDVVYPATSGGTTYTAYDGTNQSIGPLWTVKPGSVSCRVTYVCGQNWASQHPIHLPGGTSYVCSASTVPATRANPATSTNNDGLSLYAYAFGGAETTPAASTTDGFALVPGATSAGPGVLTLFLVRPLDTGRSPSVVYRAFAGAPIGTALTNWTEDFWTLDAWQPACGVPNSAAYYKAYHHLARLTAATETFDGTFDLVTRPGSAGAASFGEPATQASAVSCQTSVVH